MSKQKKKKPNALAQQKLLIAQGKNEFRRKVQWLCSLLGEGPYFKLLENYIDLIFQIKPKALKIVANDSRVSKEFIEFVKTDLNNYIDGITSEIYKDGPEISLREYIFVLYTVQNYLELYPERNVNGTFDHILDDYKNRFARLLLDIVQRSEYLGVRCSDFCECFFRVQYDFGIAKEKSRVTLNNTVIISSEAPQWRQVQIGAGKRAAARVGWSYSDAVKWMTVKPSQLGIKKAGNDAPMDVYIQQHAVRRLYERIGGRYADIMNRDTLLSFIELNAFTTGGGNILIEHRIADLKAGYFAATITDEVLLIRTFLFITHIGTPEGRRLASITGLGKLDQKYLAFDNLLTLANSDILSNDEAQELFINAGCNELLELCRIVRQSKSFWEISEQEKPLAEKLLKYIKAAKEEVSDEIPDI